ncbi:hypothetical protein M5K25_021858 [Dendrobium thyrsiflorum]|uniref:Uncharacterized protein n=1 Tax=Dendrobium thyrsiflorum TaxID=117978 RepID=A0ABD0UAU0_DENTH
MSGLRWWPGGTSASGGGPAVVRQNSSGGSAELRRWSRRSKVARAISDLSLDSLRLVSLFKKNGDWLDECYSLATWGDGEDKVELRDDFQALFGLNVVRSKMKHFPMVMLKILFFSVALVCLCMGVLATGVGCSVGVSWVGFGLLGLGCSLSLGGWSCLAWTIVGCGCFLFMLWVWLPCGLLGFFYSCYGVGCLCGCGFGCLVVCVVCGCVAASYRLEAFWMARCCGFSTCFQWTFRWFGLLFFIMLFLVLN